MDAIIISIGDELILGQTVDTNSAWLSKELAAIGCDIRLHATVADEQKRISEIILDCSKICDFLLVTGGLGPTADDLTRAAMADALGQPLEIHPAALSQVEAYFTRRRRPMSQSNRLQAMLPRGTIPIENTAGTAPGIDCRLHRAHIFVTPGVPGEMKRMFENYIAPKISESTGGAVIASRMLHTFGWPESIVGERLGTLMDRTRNPSVGTTVSGGLISLRINARAADRASALAELDKTESLCRAALGEIIFGKDDETLPIVVGEMLVGANLKVALAESCTGGYLGKLLTDVPGSSRYVDRAWITYSNESKHQMLAVPMELIEKHGAVSVEVAAAMASGAREKSGADFGLSITGIAGPDGGTPQKPIGTICFGLASKEGVKTHYFVLPGDRETVRLRAAYMSLTILRFYLQGLRLPF